MPGVREEEELMRKEGGKRKGVEKGGFNNQHPLVAFSVLPSSSSSSLVLGRGEQPKTLSFPFLSFPKSDFLIPPHPNKKTRAFGRKLYVAKVKNQTYELKKRKVHTKMLHGVLLTVPPVGDPLPVPPPLLDLCKVPRERGHRAAEEDGGGGGAGGGGGGHLGHGQGQVHAEDCGREKHLVIYGFRFVLFCSRGNTVLYNHHKSQPSVLLQPCFQSL